MNYSPRLPFPQQRKFERVFGEVQYETLRNFLRLAYTPAVMYRAMLFYALRAGKKPGVAYYAFIDMFGGPPHAKDKGSPIYLDDPDFEKWMWLRDEDSRRKWRNEKARKRRRKHESAGELGRSSGEVQAPG